jgi:Tfp pilus assembly protein PilN
MSAKRGRPFQPSNKCGRGRPRGSRNKRTLEWEEMLSEHGEALVKKCIVMALQGDRAALRLCMERLVAPCKQSPVQFGLPSITTAAELVRAQAAVLEAFSRGQLTSAHAETMGDLLDKHRRLIETEQLEARLQALEQRERGREHES